MRLSKRQRVEFIVVVSVFAIAGIATLLMTRAATPLVAVEPEQGTLSSGAVSVSDSNASASQAVKFSATITPPGGTDCNLVPSVCGYPDATNTGYTSYYDPSLGRKLQLSDLRQVGSISSTRDGEVIEKLWVKGRIKILHNNVTVRAVYIDFPITGLYAFTWDGAIKPTGTNLEYCEMNGNGTESIGLYLGNVVVSNCNIYGFRGGGQMLSGTAARPTKVQHSYVHDLYYFTGSHNTSLSTHGQSYVEFHHNNLDDGSSAALSLYCDSNTAACHHVKVTDNLFNVTRANYCVRGGAGMPDSSNIHIIGNKFGTKRFPKCGSSGPWAQVVPNNVNGNIIRDNVYVNTNLPL